MKIFRDPNLSDRDLMLLILFELARVRSDIKFINESIALEESNKSPETDAKLLEFCHNQAFDEMEADVLHFVRRAQNVEGN
jgi:hypothetical protein